MTPISSDYARGSAPFRRELPGWTGLFEEVDLLVSAANAIPTGGLGSTACSSTGMTRRRYEAASTFAVTSLPLKTESEVQPC